MARFYGKVGFGNTGETVAGVYDDSVTERSYFGTVIRDNRSTQDGVSVNSDFTLGVSIRIVGDDYAFEHIFAIRYVEYSGTLWVVERVDPERPSLTLRLGGVYNGPTA